VNLPAGVDERAWHAIDANGNGLGARAAWVAACCSCPHISRPFSLSLSLSLSGVCGSAVSLAELLAFGKKALPSVGPAALKQAFQIADADRSGLVSQDEFGGLLKAIERFQVGLARLRSAEGPCTARAFTPRNCCRIS
jgi:hypothetical protein